MAIAVRQTGFFKTTSSQGVSSGAVTLPDAEAGNSLIIVIKSKYPLISNSDNKGGVYALDGVGDQQGGHVYVLRVYVPSTTTNYTFTAGFQGPGGVMISVAEVTGLLAVDQTSAGAGIYTGTTIVAGPTALQPKPVLEFAVVCLHLYGGSSNTGTPITWTMLESNWDGFGYDGYDNDGALGEADSRVYTYLTPGIPLNPRWQLSGGTSELWMANLVLYYEKLTASFTGTPTSGAAPLSVTFTDASTGSPSAWFWDFGDGGVSPLQNPTHVYAQAGTYSVRLRIAKQHIPDDTFERLNYIVVSGGGSGGGGGLPTTPGIPNNPSLSPMPGYPAPPIPGAPWMAQAMIPKPPEPPAPEAPTVAAGLPPLVPGNAKASDGARQERANRVLASIHDGLEREQQKPRSGENDFYLLGTGFESAAAPTTSDDETIGASVGATWVHTDEDGTVTLYICFGATAGAADWRAANTAAGLGIGGITGTF